MKKRAIAVLVPAALALSLAAAPVRAEPAKPPAVKVNTSAYPLCLGNTSVRLGFCLRWYL